MNIRWSSWTMSAVVVTAIALMPNRSWAVFFALGPSSDEWGLKYDVEVDAASGDVLNVTFRLADEGRLKPIYSVTLIAFSAPRADGGRTYLAKLPLELKRAPDGRLTGQAQIRKEFAPIATVRLLTLNLDGRRQTAGAVYYDIPLKKFLNQTPAAASARVPATIGAPPSAPIAK